MKIRTDFVTNSSSSSFITVIIDTIDNNQYVFEGENILDSNPYLFLKVVNGKLTREKYRGRGEFVDIPINSVLEFFAHLFTLSSESMHSEITFDDCFAITSFLAGKISFPQMTNSLNGGSYVDEIMGIDSENIDDESELREEVVRVLEDEEFWGVNFLVDGINMAKNVNSMEDISKIYIKCEDGDYGEFMNIYQDRLEMYLDELEKILPDTYEEDKVEILLKQLKSKVFEDYDDTKKEYYPPLEETVKKAIESGDIYDILPSDVSLCKEYVFELNALEK